MLTKNIENRIVRMLESGVSFLEAYFFIDGKELKFHASGDISVDKVKHDYEVSVMDVIGGYELGVYSLDGVFETLNNRLESLILDYTSKTGIKNIDNDFIVSEIVK
ncbi:TPA: hypothetical protein KON59_003895 [Clostridioides difficile]|nr:hypothetical protein [Clostridioides difficile]